MPKWVDKTTKSAHSSKWLRDTVATTIVLGSVCPGIRVYHHAEPGGKRTCVTADRGNILLLVLRAAPNAQGCNIIVSLCFKRGPLTLL
jgi:hypothetical protein